MPPFPTPPREVLIGDAAAFVGITPRTIRHYHQVGLLPERERGSDGRRRYGYPDIIRLLWIRRMAEVGIALDDIRDAVGATSAGAEVEGVLARLEGTLAAQEADLQRKRTAIRRMRELGSRLGLLDDFVSRILEDVPEGSLRQADLDALLVTERTFGPLGAAIQAGRFLALAASPELRAESDRVDAAEEALDDTVDVDDPRVAQVAAARRTLESALLRAVEESGQPADEDALFLAWEELHPHEDADSGSGNRSAQDSRTMSAAQIVRRMPYDLAPARLRAMQLAEGVSAGPGSDASGGPSPV